MFHKNLSSSPSMAQTAVGEFTGDVSRAVRKAYGIGIRSGEEIVSFERQSPARPVRKLPPESSKGSNGQMEIAAFAIAGANSLVGTSSMAELVKS